MKNKTVYLQNGEEAELLFKFQNNSNTYYVVKETDYECGGYKNSVYTKVYENYKDVPLFGNKTKLEKEVEELEKKVKELKEQKEKIEKEFKSVYVPKYKIGTSVYCTIYGDEVEELKISCIVFTEQEDNSFYEYYCDKEYRKFNKIGSCYFLTREEAEKARQEYLEKEKVEKYKRAEEEFKKAKERLEEMKCKMFKNNNL